MPAELTQPEPDTGSPMDFTADDIIKAGRDNGADEFRTAKALKQWSGELADEAAKQYADKPEAFSNGMARVRDDTDRYMASLQMDAMHSEIAKHIPDPDEQKQFINDFKDLGFDPEKATPEIKPLVKRLDEIAHDPVFTTPRPRTMNVLVNGLPAARAMVEDTNGGSAAHVTFAKDDSAHLVTLPKATDDDVKREIETSTKKARALTDEANQIIAYPETDQEARNGQMSLANRLKNQADDQAARVQRLQQGGRDALLQEHLTEALKKPGLVEKMGDKNLLGDVTRGLAKVTIDTGRALEAVAGGGHDLFKGADEALSQALPGSSMRQFRGGFWDQALQGGAESFGQMLPTLASGGVSKLALGKAAEISARTSLLPIIPSSYGRGYAETNQYADALDAAGNKEEAAKVRSRAHLAGLMQAAIEYGSELIFAEGSQPFAGKGGKPLRQRVTDLLLSAVKEGAEEPIAGAAERGIKDPLITGQTPDLFGPMPLEFATGAVMGLGMGAPGLARGKGREAAAPSVESVESGEAIIPPNLRAPVDSADAAGIAGLEEHTGDLTAAEVADLEAPVDAAAREADAGSSPATGGNSGVESLRASQTTPISDSSRPANRAAGVAADPAVETRAQARSSSENPFLPLAPKMTRSQPLDKRATGERMAPEGGAAQTNEPSPGGLSEADGKYLSALEQGDEQGVSLIGFSPVVYHGTPDARFEEFSSSAEKRGAKPDQIHSAFYFTDHMETAQGYRGNGYGFDDLPGNPISGDVHRMSEAEFPGGTLWWWDKDNRKQVALADFKKANRKGQFQFEFPNRFQVALHDATSTASAMRMIREWWEKNARRANYNQHIHSGLISARLITKKPRIIDADGAGFHSMTHLIRQARDQGFDSVIIRNLIDVAQNPARAVPQTTFVVFSPAQIQKANAGYLSESSAATQIITSQDSVLGSPVPGSPVSQLENRKPRGATEGGESGAGVGIKAKQSGVNARGDVPQDQPVSSEPAADKPTGFRNLHGSGRTGGFLNTDIIHHGADLIAKGIKDFGKWSVEMVKRFGSAMRDYLHGVWQQVTTRTMPKMGGGRVTVRRPEGGFIHGPQPMPRETQSRFARPEATERLYQTRADEDVKSQALAWVDSVPMERAVAQLESGALPAGMTDDVGQRAAAELLMRTSEMMSTGTEVQKLQARTLSHRMGKVWQGWMSQEAGRNLRQRAVANAELQPFAPILAAENALIDRADAVVGKRFEGGAKGGAEKAKKVADDAGKKAGENLGSKLDGENPQQRERRKGVTAKVQQSKAKMTKAQSTAESILNTLATTHADPQIWNAKGKPDPVRALYHEHLRKPMTYDEFTGRMAVLGVPENLAGTIHDAATMEIEARAEIARVIAAEKAQAREVRQVEVAENRASELIYATEERLRQGSKDLETTKTGDTINKAFRDQVKKPMAWAAFRDRLQALRVGEAVSERLFRTAERERMDQESMQNFRNDQAARELARDESKLAKMLNELRRKLAPGMTWADIFTELPSAQKERQRAIYQRLQLDERLKGLSAEERLALTNELDKAWQRERRKVFNRELEKAGVLGEKDATDRVKVQKATPRLLRMINLGMMNSEMFRESVAQEYGLKMLTAAESGHLRALAEQIQSTPDGLPRRKIAQDFINRLQDLTQSTKLEILESFWTAAVLSGWRTHTDILLGALNGIEDVGFGALVTAFRTGNADVGARAIGRMLGNLPTAVAEALHHVVTGDRSMMRNYDAEVKAAMEDGHKLMGAAGRQLLNKGGMAKAPGAFMELISRMLTAWDHINSTSTFEGAKMMALARHPELYQRALLIDHKDRVAARQRARLELTGGREPQTITEKLQEKARIKEILDETIPAEVIARATEIGRDSALQGYPTGLGWAVVEGVKAVTALPGRGVEALEKSGTSNPAAKAVLHALRVASTVSKVATGTKFVRTVAHGINRTLSYAPGLGLLRFAEGGMSGAKADILIAKQLIGTAVGLATLALFRGKDDDEEGIEGSWKGLNPQQRSQLYAQGKQPNSVWYRNAQGKIVSFNFQQWGVAGILSTVGAMEDQRRYHGHNRSDLTVLINGIVSGAMSWSDKAQLQGIQQVFGDSAYSSAGIGESLAKRLNTFAATTVGGLIPRVVKDVDQVMYPELHDSSVWWGKWAAQVPMARELATGKRVDIFGNDIKMDRTPLSRVVHVGFSDGAYHTLGLLNARDVWLPDPSSGVRVVRLTNGDRREMTPTEKDRYQRATGAGYKKFIEEHGAELLKLPVDEARKRVQRDTKPIRSLAAFQAVQR